MMELVTVIDHLDGRRSLSGVEEWVASLPVQVELTSVEPVQIVRKKGVFQARGLNAADVYQMAQAARKARERQASRTSVVSRGESSNIFSKEIRQSWIQDRVGMLRTAYAAQRIDRMNLQQPQSDGTVSIVSLDSSNLDALFSGFELGEEESEEENYPEEELLLSLGFGGPPQGLERVPERFLQPSQMHGVNLQQMFSQQHEIDDTMDSVLGYKGLSGPPSRRPSSIVARLYEKMKEQNKLSSESHRKSSGQPSSFATSSFEQHPLIVSHPEETRENKQTHPSQQFVVSELNSVLLDSDPAMLHSPINNNLNNSDHRSSLTCSSRRSSLRRQDCFEDDEEFDVFEATLPHKPEIGLASTIGLPLAGYLTGPAVYITPPGSVTSQLHQSNINNTLLVYPTEADPIFAVLQLAAEAYRVRLDGESENVKQTTVEKVKENDWKNHNCAQQEMEDMGIVKKELKRELDRTDDLLARLRNRLTLEQRLSCDSSNLRSVLDDMTDLLQHQRDLYDRVSEWRNRMNPSAVPSESHIIPCLSTAPSSPTTVSASFEPSDSPLSGWMERFERRLTSRIRNTVRREIKRARHIKKRYSKY